MDILYFDRTQKAGIFKPLNATNGGPWHKRHAIGQNRSTLEDYKLARIPYSRNHDSAMCQEYGSPYSHDISCIFPDFNADPYEPESYDFACTDESILICLEAGTETFFRLGQSIEHHIKKHATLPPKDFHKWAVICEHIIRHYNEGWANGYYLNIQYWEIWNEPDLDTDDSPDKLTWGGTKAQFFDLYAIAAGHLKQCFPNLKIGGPAISHDFAWADDFLREMSARQIPLDFFSWHGYTVDPTSIRKKAETVRNLLDKYHYEQAESILNEWNYVRNFSDQFLYSVQSIHGMKGAAFLMAYICEAQKSTIDMLMYYDTRPSVFNGVFDFYTCEKLKGYYPLYWYGMFYDMKAEIPATNSIENIYTICGVNEAEKVLAVVTYYTDDDAARSRQLKLDFGTEGTYEVYLLDETHSNTLMGTTGDLTFEIQPNTCLLIKEI